MGKLSKASFAGCLITCFFLNANAALIVDYKFDDNAQDSSGLGNHGTIIGNAAFTNSPQGRAISFNNPLGNTAATQWVEIPNSASILALAPSSLSFAILYRSIDTDQVNGRLFGGGASSQLAYVYNATNVDEAYTRIDDVNGQLVTSREDVIGDPNAYTTDGNWHWGIGVLDRNAGVFRQYVDLHLVAEVSFTNLANIDIHNLTIGNISNQATSSARLTDVDRFMLFNHALSPEEVGELVNPVPEPGVFVALACGFALSLRRKTTKKPNHH